jgi:hypothetical protein
LTCKSTNSGKKMTAFSPARACAAFARSQPD